jgi:hypothetical protein
MGPYYHQAYLATSADGMTWVSDDTHMLRDHTSVPDILYWNGGLWVYAVDGAQHGLIALRQNADGTWSENRVIFDTFDGAYAVDPDVVILPDGSLRLYFFDFHANAGGNTGQIHNILSAVSTDGINFTVEAGVRFSEFYAADPDIVQQGGAWWMYIPMKDQLAALRSDDGLTFTPAGTVTESGMSSTVMLPDGSLRQYYCGPGGTRYHDSADGLTWGASSDVILANTCGAAVTQQPDGSWIMAHIRIVQTEGAQPGQGQQGQPGQPAQPGQPNQGQVDAQGRDLNGPYYHQIYLARSADGLAWEMDNVMIRDHTSVPEIARWNDTLWIYAVDGVQHGLIVLRQGDDDLWWESRVEIAGFDAANAVDPNVITLPDGSLRLYFFGFQTPGASPGENRGPATIYSAVSSDGVHFTLEEGARFQSDTIITDPDVVQAADGTWWLFVSQGMDLIIARSADGLAFEAVGASHNGGVSGTVRLDDGTLRQYVCSPQGGIISQTSADGATWTVESGTRIPGRVCDPSLIREADGSWLMVYKLSVSTPGAGMPGQPPTPSGP